MRNKLAKLIDVKSIMTLALTAGFVGLTVAGKISGQQFLTIYTVIIGFYFGTQAQKRSAEEPEGKQPAGQTGSTAGGSADSTES